MPSPPTGRGQSGAERFHYLGFGGAVGENLQYVARDGQGPWGWLALVFGGAAWKCQDRDRFIGWTAEQRQKNLGLVVNNSRFLILPWVTGAGFGQLGPGAGLWADRPRLAGQIRTSGGGVGDLRRAVRFRGTVYRAANWQRAGVTAGRSRQDRHTCLQVPRKELYLYPLRRSFREALCA